MITAIICAAGKGERAGFSQNKVLQELNGMPVLCYSLSAFAACGVDEILVTCREEDEKTILPLL
ncbi:MAG: NTP transferase domain-containing protein, partial [Clostridia bacterium]|nr:NTP transferase domain-containing protein [Clostridia bacterium]